MPYFNMNATMEFAYNNQHTPVLVGQFIELIKLKAIDSTKIFIMQR